MKRVASIVLIILGILVNTAVAQVDYSHLAKVDEVIENAIESKLVPGAVLAVVHKNQTVYLKAYGCKSVYPDIEPMTVETVFDLASVTKPFTAIAIMQLLERGKLRLYDSVSTYLTYVPSEVKIIHLLTHTSGIADYSGLLDMVEREGLQNREALERYIVEKLGRSEVGTKFEYSCLNYVLLQYIVEKVSGKTLQEFEKEHIFAPLGMKHTDFNPQDKLRGLCAPTEKMLDGSVLKGEVHDSLARMCNSGISGNAGLFSNAEDLAKVVKALLNNGEYEGARILGALTCKTMRTVPEGFEEFGRSLGWDNYSRYASDHGDFFDRKETYGHTGYTGPNMFIDPVSQTAVIFLAHRVHPYNVGSMVTLRAKLANIIASAFVK